MAEATFSINFKIAAKELKKTMQELRAFQKELQKGAIGQAKLTSRLDRDRSKDFEKFKKSTFDMLKKQNQMYTKDYANRKTERTQELRHAKSIARLNELERRKTREGRRKEEREAERGFFGRVLGRRGGRAARGAVRLGGAVAGGALGMLVGTSVAAYQRYLGYGRALGPTLGLPGQRRGIRGAPGARLGYGLTETAQQANIMRRATGVTGPRELQLGARAGALEPQEVAQVFAQIRQAGMPFAGGQQRGESAGGRVFREIIAAGMYSGLEKARLPEFVQGITSLTMKQSAISAGVVDPTQFAKVLAIMGKTDLPGFQGARGVNMAGRLQQAFLKPGGGEWGETFMRMAMGFGKPGSSTGFYEAERRREEGLTTENIQRLIGEVISQFGAGREGALAMRQVTGISLGRSEELLKLGESGEFSAEKLGEIEEIITSSESLEKQALKAMQKNGGVLRRIAGRQNIMIGIGAKVASTVEKIEDWQLDLVKYLIEIAEYMKGLYDLMVRWFGEEHKKAAERLRKEREVSGWRSPAEETRLRSARIKSKRGRAAQTYTERAELEERARGFEGGAARRKLARMPDPTEERMAEVGERVAATTQVAVRARELMRTGLSKRKSYDIAMTETTAPGREEYLRGERLMLTMQRQHGVIAQERYRGVKERAGISTPEYAEAAGEMKKMGQKSTEQVQRIQREVDIKKQRDEKKEAEREKEIIKEAREAVGEPGASLLPKSIPVDHNYPFDPRRTMEPGKAPRNSPAGGPTVVT